MATNNKSTLANAGQDLKRDARVLHILAWLFLIAVIVILYVVAVNAEEITPDIPYDKLFDYTCPLTPGRYDQLFNQYLTLSFNAKRCLPDFMSKESVDVFDFSMVCPLGYGQQALVSSAVILAEYEEKGFATVTPKKGWKEKLEEYEMDERTRQTVMKQWGDYSPKTFGGDVRLSKACIQRWADQKRYGDERQSSGFREGVLMSVFGMIVIVYVINKRILRGEK